MAGRAEIRMSAAEVEAFLHERRRMFIATNGANGHPHVVPMSYGFIGDDPAFWTIEQTQKVANLRRDPRFTALVEDGDVYADLRGVQLYGTASIIDDPDVVMALGREMGARYPAAQGGVALEVKARNRVVVVLGVDRVTSWDHRKLA